MKNKLQYAYSITVFVGVLATAYLMMNNEGNARVPQRTVQGPTFRAEATVVDPVVSQLFQMENALAQLPKEKPAAEKRDSREKANSPSASLR